MKLHAGVCDEPEGCGRSFTEDECCICPECGAVFCDDCWGEPAIHSPCKQADDMRTALATEDDA